MAPELLASLDEQGYCVLPHYMDSALRLQLLERIEQLFTQEGDRAGHEFKYEPGVPRLANLVDKGEIFRRVWADATILPLIAHVLSPRFKLSSLNARSATPGEGHQPLHVDQGLLPDEQGFTVCNVVWMLDDFTVENGAPRAVPGTHRSGKRPQEALADPNLPHPGEVLVTAPAGAVVVMNAHLWHGGTINRTQQPRRAIHSFYCRADMPQQQYQKRLLRPQTQSALPPDLRALLALDDPHNDELCSQVTGQSGFLK